MHIHLPSAKDAKRIENAKEQANMRYLSKKLTDYIVKNGVISDELYEVYQYGFQIGAEMFICFVFSLSISIFLHMIPEFVIFTVIFMLLRSYAGGMHLNSFIGCLICSIMIQTAILIINKQYVLTNVVSWLIILSGAFLIFLAAPVENINRELNLNEKKNCKRITMKILICVIVFSVGCMLVGKSDIVSLIALTILLVFLSQYLGIIKYIFEKNRRR